MKQAAVCWAVVPGAGVGRRLGGPIPKQYLRLGPRLVIEHVLMRLLENPRIQAVVVVLGNEDNWWPDTAFADHPEVIRTPGGAERCHSVVNGLEALDGRAASDDWVLVHDAARPCLRRVDLERLMERLASHPVGGILGVPVRDTMKRTDVTDAILETMPRERLWHAFTPQMFRYGLLRDALQQALEQGLMVTDEASAMEFAGHRPLMVQGHADNIKITRPEDLTLATFYLGQQSEDG
jgi:2-C-methyl-D-erythritol 4-phosphate cytidylyltransferase